MRSKLRTPVLQNLFNFVHKPTPAASKTALQPSCCNTHADQPLTASDRLWVYGLVLGGIGVWALVAWAVLR
jgi:hypothetical protein